MCCNAMNFIKVKERERDEKYLWIIAQQQTIHDGIKILSSVVEQKKILRYYLLDVPEGKGRKIV